MLSADRIEALLTRLGLDIVEQPVIQQRLGGNLAAPVLVQLLPLPARVSHATDLGDAALEERLVSGEVIADELAGPAAEERSGVMAPATLGKVIHHQRDRIELRRPVAPKVRLVRVAQAGLEHRYRRLIGVQHRTAE